MTVSRSISRTAAATTGAPRSRPKSTGTLAKSPAVIGRANSIIEACERDLKRPLIGARRSTCFATTPSGPWPSAKP